MEARQIKERITAVEERIEKRHKTYEGYGKRIAKLQAKAEAETDPQEKRFLGCKVEGLQDDAKRCLKKIADDDALVVKYYEQMHRQEQIEQTYFNAVPEVMKALEQNLIQEWEAWDKKRRDELKYKRNKTAAETRIAYMSDTDIEVACVREARSAVIDLYERVYSKTGEVKSWHGIHLKGVGLNGVVEGEAGTVSVETIYAGGYNIQRLHFRTLVHEL